MKGDVNPVAGVIVEQLENFMSTSSSEALQHKAKAVGTGMAGLKEVAEDGTFKRPANPG